MTFFSNPKRRDYVLNPRGKALYDDSNRFGTKMLEKMGWSKGKGLGANLDGQLDFIKVSHKGDQKGVGFKDRDDQWTTHESNFNSLLSSFKTAENSDEESQECAVQHFRSDEKIPKIKKEKIIEKEELFSGVSLEERSKNSRARVHYKKFTRGKDLARYSEKDLANIFGKKSLQFSAEAEGGESNEDEKDEKSSENTPNFGITTIQSGTTIDDYFRSKMKNANTGLKKSSTEQVDNVESFSSIKKEKKNRKKSKAVEFASNDNETNYNISETNEETAVVVLSEHTSINGRRKRKHDSDDIEESTSSKKKKSIDQAVETLDESEVKLVNEMLPASKKSKKNKKEKVCSSNGDVSVETVEKSRKSKNEVRMEDDYQTANGVNVKDSHRVKKSKSTNSEGVGESQATTNGINGVNDDSIGVDNEAPRPHKKSKRKGEVNEMKICNGTPTISADQPVTANFFDFVAKAADKVDINGSEVVTDNIYEIRRYRTEIFRYVDLQAFPGSTLYDIPGYGYTSEMTLKIVDKGDENRLINTMWNEAQDKYAGDKKKKKKFVEHIGDLKKKNIFKL